jgi:hypothetical protein
MSVNFNPNEPSSTPSPEYNPFYSKGNFFEKWAQLVYEGNLKERLSSKDYCERAWTQQTGTSPKFITQAFMEKCQKDCEEFKSFCNFSRLN